MSNPSVAVLGTGIMGAGVARSLLRAGLDVAVWNRSSERARPLADDGARVGDSVTDAVRGADVVLTTLYDADAVLAVAEELTSALGPDAVWVQSATAGIEGTDRIAAVARDRGATLVEAMMLGTRKPAEDGTLVLLVGGDEQLRGRLDPVLDAMSSKVVWVGPQVGQGTRLKLACNAWIASITAAAAQSLVLARGLGLDPQLFLEAIGGGASDTPYAHVKAPAMLEPGSGETSFALDGVRKDLDLIRQAAAGCGVDQTLIAALVDTYAAASRAGHGAEDMASVSVAFG